jgi:hypothetical protein
MNLTQLLLLLIFITLLGAWSFVGISVLIIGGIILICWIGYWVIVGSSSVIHDLIKGFKQIKKPIFWKNLWQVIKPSIITMMIISFLLFVFFIDPIKDKLSEKQEPLKEELSQSISIYNFIFENLTNVRSCRSIGCEVVGQYPAGTKIELYNPFSKLSEWVKISWVENGEIKIGYVNKGTLKEIR